MLWQILHHISSVLNQIHPLRSLPFALFVLFGAVAFDIKYWHLFIKYICYYSHPILVFTSDSGNILFGVAVYQGDMGLVLQIYHQLFVWTHNDYLHIYE